MMAGLAYILCIIGTVSIVVGILIELAGHNIRGSSEAEPLWEAWDLKPHTSVWREGTVAPWPCSSKGVWASKQGQTGRKHPMVAWLECAIPGKLSTSGSQRKPS